MVEWTNVERAKILELYWKSGSIIQAQRDFKRIYKIKKCPSRNTILSYAKKFHETGSVQATSPPGRVRSVRTPENIAIVCEAVQHSPHHSTRKLSKTLHIERTSLRRMLDDLHRQIRKNDCTEEIEKGNGVDQHPLGVGDEVGEVRPRLQTDAEVSSGRQSETCHHRK